VPCCNECNGKHTDFDERLRALAALEITRNQGGDKILLEKVFGSTMKESRQGEFMIGLSQTFQKKIIPTPNGPKVVGSFQTRAEPLYAGVRNIVKGLLRHFYPQVDYYTDRFCVFDIHSATLNRWPSEAQLETIRKITSTTRGDARGNFNEFRFWRQVDLEPRQGVWLLVFYEAVAFVVAHQQIGR
jgi:hypothetical protein